MTDTTGRPRLAHGRFVGLALCELLGLDANAERICKIVIEADVHEAARVILTRYVDRDGLQDVVEQKYTLLELEEP